MYILGGVTLEFPGLSEAAVAIPMLSGHRCIHACWENVRRKEYCHTG